MLSMLNSSTVESDEEKEWDWKTQYSILRYKLNRNKYVVKSLNLKNPLYNHKLKFQLKRTK